MTRQARGMKGTLNLMFESTFGTTPTTGTVHRLPFNKNALTSKQNLIESNTITGTRNPVPPALGQIDVAGSIEVPLDVRNIGVWLALLYGAPVTTDVAKGTSYKHVFTIPDTMPSASIEKGFSDLNTYAMSTGCKISKFSVDAQVGNNEITAKLDIMGASEVINNTSIGASITPFSILRFNNFNAAVMEGGTALGIARKVSLDLDNGLDGDTYCLNGSGARGDILEGIVKPTGSIEVLFENTDLLNKAIKGTETSLQLTFTTGAFSLAFLLPQVLLERTTPAIDGPKGVALTMNYRAYETTNTENTSMQATLINDVAEYLLV